MHVGVKEISVLIQTCKHLGSTRIREAQPLIFYDCEQNTYLLSMMSFVLLSFLDFSFLLFPFLLCLGLAGLLSSEPDTAAGGCPAATAP